MITARFYAKKLSHNVWFCFLPSTFLLASPWKLSLISQFSSSSSLMMITFAEKSVLVARVLTLHQKNSDMFKNWVNVPKLIGRLFSPSQKLKKLSHPFRLCFELGLGIHTCPPCKILWGVYGASKEHVFHKGPPFRFMSISFIVRGDPYEHR